MKVVILAGGRGTRISEESVLKPKPMIEIGGKPILWHIMKLYSAHGLHDFIICCGYRGYIIKEYFSNYFLHNADVTFDMARNEVEVHHKKAEPWRVTLVDTGEDTMTGGRLGRVREYIGGETFCFTYGDGLADVDIRGSVDFHRKHERKATVTAVVPPGRFGALIMGADNDVTAFQEKPPGDGGYINGGFFVLEPSVIDYIRGDDEIFEKHPMESLARDGEMTAFRHDGFWHPMDTLRDKNHLENLWSNGKAPWKLWD